MDYLSLLILLFGLCSGIEQFFTIVGTLRKSHVNINCTTSKLDIMEKTTENVVLMMDGHRYTTSQRHFPPDMSNLTVIFSVDVPQHQQTTQNVTVQCLLGDTYKSDKIQLIESREQFFTIVGTLRKSHVNINCTTSKLDIMDKTTENVVLMMDGHRYTTSQRHFPPDMSNLTVIFSVDVPQHQQTTQNVTVQCLLGDTYKSDKIQLIESQERFFTIVGTLRKSHVNINCTTSKLDIMDKTTENVVLLMDGHRYNTSRRHFPPDKSNLTVMFSVDIPQDQQTTQNVTVQCLLGDTYKSDTMLLIKSQAQTDPHRLSNEEETTNIGLIVALTVVACVIVAVCVIGFLVYFKRTNQCCWKESETSPDKATMPMIMNLTNNHT